MSDLRNEIVEEVSKSFKKLCKKYGEQEVRERLLAQGASRTIVNYWISGERKVSSAEGIYLICKAFPDLSADWLLGLQSARSKDPDTRMIAKHTGLSDESIEALHYMTELCKITSAKYHRKAAEAISFLNRVLEGEWTKIERKRSLREKYSPDNLEQEYASVRDLDFFFSLLEEYVTGSGKIGYYAFKRHEDEDYTTLIPNDEIFRNVLHDEIEEYLEAMSQRIGAVELTRHKMGAMEWIRKRYYDSIDNSKPFTINDFDNAIREYVKDANAEEDAGIEPATLSLDFENLEEYLKEVESWQAQD